MGLKGHLLLTIAIDKVTSWIFNRSSLSFGGIIKYGMMLDQAKSHAKFNKKIKESEDGITL